MRLPLEKVAVLERARLTLVPVYGDVARCGLGADERPFASGRESRASKAAEAGGKDRFLHRIRRQFSPTAARQKLVAPGCAIGIQCLVAWNAGMEVPRGDGRCRGVGRGVVHVVVSDLDCGSGVAPSHAGRPDHADFGCGVPSAELGHQRLGAGQFTGEGIAHADGDRRWRSLALLHNVKMGVEAGDLVDFGLRETHFLRERPQMRRREVPVAVLDEVEVLDQQVAIARTARREDPESPQARGPHTADPSASGARVRVPSSRPRRRSYHCRMATLAYAVPRSPPTIGPPNPDHCNTVSVKTPSPWLIVGGVGSQATVHAGIATRSVGLGGLAQAVPIRRLASVLREPE